MEDGANSVRGAGPDHGLMMGYGLLMLFRRRESREAVTARWDLPPQPDTAWMRGDIQHGRCAPWGPCA